jgi:hypothetical protein
MPEAFECTCRSLLRNRIFTRLMLIILFVITIAVAKSSRIVLIDDPLQVEPPRDALMAMCGLGAAFSAIYFILYLANGGGSKRINLTIAGRQILLNSIEVFHLLMSIYMFNA